MNYFNVPRFDVPEMIISGDDFKIKQDVWYDVRIQGCNVIKKICESFNFVLENRRKS